MVKQLAFMSILLAGASVPALAAETEWTAHDSYARSRLVASSEVAEDGSMLFGWEIELQPGWKTYWRTPGEAGLPVLVKVGGSDVEIDYPLPHRFDFYGIASYGYEGQVILPFHVTETQLNTAQTVDVSFMICKDICIPMTAKYDLGAFDVQSETPLVDIRLDSWMQKVPKPQSEASALEVADVKLVGAPGRQRLVVDVEAESDLDNADLFVEAEDGTAFSAPAIRLAGDGTRARAVVPAIMRDGDDLSGKSVRVTFTDGQGRAVEKRFQLSGP